MKIHVKGTIRDLLAFKNLVPTRKKRFKRAPNATVLIWKVLRVAETRFRRLDAPELLAEVYAGETFVDGQRVPKPASWKVAA